MRVPKKNIDPVVVDIKRKDHDYSKYKENNESKKQSFKESNYEDLASLGRDKRKESHKQYGSIEALSGFRMWFRYLSLAAVSVFFVFGSMIFLDVNDIKNSFFGSGDISISQFVESIESIRNLDFNEAHISLSKSLAGLEYVNETLNDGPKGMFVSAVSSVVSPVQDANKAFKNIIDANKRMIEMMELMEEVKTKGFTYFQNDGDKLIRALKDLQSLVLGVRGDLEDFRNNSKDIGGLLAKTDTPLSSLMGSNFDGEIIEYSSDLVALDSFLNGLIEVLGSTEESHILLMFQNPSEIRPAGGFLGSYGILTIQGGEMKDIVVDDIYWPDHPQNFDLTLIPPKPLQHITKDWGARDANWFFDFPTSAKAVIYMLESSKIYQERNLSFDGTIALNTDVLGTVVDAVGPIDVEEYNMTIDKENFLAELQREVETGRDAVPGENPKKILSVITPEILDRLNSLSAPALESMMENIGNHVSNKDIMIYAEDARLNNLLGKSGINGSVFNIPSGFWGNYFSVINSNIAGGKTDAFVSQDIDIEIEVFTDGVTMVNALVKRKHMGGEEIDEWYNVQNKNYMKILSNPGTDVLLFDGDMKRAEIDRDYENYEVLPYLEDIHSTRDLYPPYDIWKTKEFNRDAYASWVFTDPGEVSEVNVRYKTLSPKDFEFAPGKKFRFVYDKQSGVDSGLNVLISAPSGYFWKESNSRVYRFDEDNTDGRVILELTVQKR